MMTSYAKNPRVEIPRLLELARIAPRPCLLRVPKVCTSYGSDTSCCACHGNGFAYNKGGAMKAHDFFSVWGCARCHAWLDSSYSAEYDDKQEAFRVALYRQVVEWAKIVQNMNAKPADRNACTQALDELVTRGYARTDPVLYATPILEAR